MSTFELYVFLHAPAIAGTMKTAAWFVIGGLVLMGFGLLWFDEHAPTSRTRMARLGRQMLAAAICALLVQVPLSMVPERELMYVVAGWEAGQNVEGLGEVPDEAIELLRAKIRAHIDAMQAAGSTQEASQ